MNLYKIIFAHHNVREARVGLVTLLLANSDTEVYDWIASQPTTREGQMFNNWRYEETNNSSRKDIIIRFKGDINDPDIYETDAYHGMVLYGWELLKENVTSDHISLKELGMLSIKRPDEAPIGTWTPVARRVDYEFQCQRLKTSDEVNLMAPKIEILVDVLVKRMKETNEILYIGIDSEGKLFVTK